MDIKYPEVRCEESPVKAHYYTVIVGNIWRCKYCWATVCLPSGFAEAVRFCTAIKTMGIDRAYRKYLSHKPKIKETLIKLEEIRLLRKVMPQRELMLAIAAIVAVKREPVVEHEDSPRDTRLMQNLLDKPNPNAVTKTLTKGVDF